ncbi:JAB domain-containing protein [Mucilaginibacter sp. BJC16-A38]|uniref:JAB domain-containing protein n=1 Tax=Mucilaginibacter phenanthrenivorans TaxID=1234842 RepID=UPI002158485B|nr:JAB domain-containing protein [Mucilaginibacter phenanthrenivorans]MCR8561049.1 JAB domain-containing protein [Mucilaginibacter phenanthrenivorans]
MHQFDAVSLYKVAEVELVYRNSIPPESRPYINKSQLAHKVLRASWDENRIGLVEQFKIVLLDIRNNCLGICDISSGGLSACFADPKLVFMAALKGKASKIIAAHNHPSGNNSPSGADIELTNRLIEGGRILDIKVVEHIILTSDGYYSFADNGLIP